jgi:hypothetical protein
MVRSTKIWRRLRIWWAGPLALVLCMVTSGKGVCAEERVVPDLAIPVVTGGSPALDQAQGLAEARTANDPKMRYLIEELITQRFEGARLSIDLAEARSEAAHVKEISHGQAELLTALIAALRIRDRQAATLQAETADLRQRLEAAQTELERRRGQAPVGGGVARSTGDSELKTMMALRDVPVARAPQ